MIKSFLSHYDPISNHIWLSPTPSEKYESNGIIIPNWMEK